MNKNKLKELAQEAIQFSFNNYYKNEKGETVYITVKPTSEVIEGNIKDLTKEPTHTELSEVAIEVTNSTTIRALREVTGPWVGILNFASATSPGGGFLSGSVAQEESLARNSNLYKAQLAVEKLYYGKNKKESSIQIAYPERLIVSKNVTFYREDTEIFDRPSSATIITSAAPNMSKIRDSLSLTEVKMIRLNRIRNIIKSFILADCKTIILGAWGCGVFKNSPEEVAEEFYKVLCQEGYGLYFDKILFAVYGSKDSDNYKAFECKFR